MPTQSAFHLPAITKVTPISEKEEPTISSSGNSFKEAPIFSSDPSSKDKEEKHPEDE